MKRPILISSLILLFTMGLATARTIHVPGAYPYIELSDAISSAQNGDVIIVAQGEYPGSGFTINRDIMVTSSNPDEPNVVAATIINCAGEEQIGFRLNGAGGTVVLKGLTIINGAPNAGTTIPPVPVPGVRGNANNGWGLTGGGVIINGNHIVSNCVIRNCTVTAGNASIALPSAAGAPDADPPIRPTHPGGHGGLGGTGSGGGIAVLSGSPRIENTIIEGCIVNGGNASMGQDGLAAVPGDPNYPGGPGGNGGNGGSTYGGGIYCAGGTPIFENCTIRSCQAFAANGADGGNGGAGADTSVTDQYGFSGWGQGGHAGVPGLAHGAGVYCDNGTTATFIDCNFIDNHAYGALGGNGGDSDANDQTSYWRGGLGGLATMQFVNAAITAIIQRLPGGHPLQPGDFPPQSQGGVAIPAENYSANGGGVYIEHGSTATFTGCTFRDNVTRGSISGVGGTHTLLDTVILNDFTSAEQPRNPTRIPSFGGGVYCADTTTTFTDCTIQGNWTVQDSNQYPGDPYYEPNYTGDEYTGYGGGMCFDGGTLVELNHCNISDNNAPVGGGVFASALTDFHVDDCNFVGNWAYLGAGLFSIDNFSSISRSNFIANRAYDPNGDLYGSGGGLFCFSTDVFILDCIISENIASGFGAGIYMAGEVAIPPLTAEPVLKNCLLSDNEAGVDGGGIYCDWYTEPNIINCTITGNEARGDPPFGVGYGGGLYCSYESDVNIINSIIWGNAGPNTIGPELAVETWFGFGPTTLTVSYCDIEGGEEGVWVDYDSTLNWGAGNIDEDPLFVEGYHLSQVAAGQGINSPCVDAGKGLAAELGLQNYYTTRTDNIFDVFDVDMGYHYPAITEVSGDFDGDGDVDLADLARLLSYWLEDRCDLLGWCGGTDLDLDMDVDFVDYALFAQAYAESIFDVDPPEPDPSTWEIAPYETSPFVISMTATTANDESGTVEYFFSCTSGGGNSSGWQVGSTYQDIVVADETTYCYTVKTRDLYLNETGPSDPCCVRIDHTPPWPDPSTWAVNPHPLSSSEIHMMATTASDPSGGVQYQFECVGGGGHSSDWQDSPEYTDTGLAALTEYTYRVRTRDVHNNIGGYSDAESATTLP